MQQVYQLTVFTAEGEFYESHRHHDITYLTDLAEVYKKHGHIVTVKPYLAA